MRFSENKVNSLVQLLRSLSFPFVGPNNYTESGHQYKQMWISLSVIALTFCHRSANVSAAVGRFPPHIRGSLADGVFVPEDLRGKCHDLYTSKDACDADPVCSWCECSAVPSSCFDLTDVDKLPPSVFACSKESDLLLLPQDHRVIEAATQELSLIKEEVDPEELKCFLKQQDKDTCIQDASLHCSWCTIEEEGQEAEGCLPGFVAKSLLDKHALTECSPSPARSSLDVEETFPNPHGVLCGFHADHDSCDTDDKCSWCQVTLPHLKDQLPETCASKESAQQMIDMKIFSSCDGVSEKDQEEQDDILTPATSTNAKPLSSATSTSLKHTFLFDSHIKFSLEDDAVDPSFCDPKSPKSLAGYVSLQGSIYDEGKEDKHYFYMFFESRSKADENTPFFIWLTGGPGCSSSLALFAENGPCSVNEDGDGTIPNPYSWNSNAHALWLDQPTGVGFSYGAVDDHDEEMVGENAYYFLQSFLQMHPEYAKNPLFITGESYAGHYGKRYFFRFRTWLHEYLCRNIMICN